MQPFTIQDRPDAAAALLSELAALSVLGIKGELAVEIVDDRTGRVVQRIEAPNYVNTTQWSIFAKALQKLAWTFGYQGDATTVTNRAGDGRDPRTIPTLRNDFIGCWTDTTAEDTTDRFAEGEVIAWAHRFQQGSPSTRQGLVQPTLCTLSDTAVKWVFEWATPNGNGTFQSVGWRRLSQNTNTGDAILSDAPQLSRRLTAVGTSAIAISSSPQESWTAGPTSNYLAAYYNSADGKMYGIVLATGSIWKLCSAAVTIDAGGNYSTGNITDESANTLAAGLRGNSYSFGSGASHGFTRLGAAGDWIMVGISSNGTSRRPEIRRVTTAGVVSYTNANAGTYTVESGFTDVTYDGTDLWVVARNGSTGISAIHRIAAATGTISATLTVSGLPAYFPPITTSARTFEGIEWDAGRSCLWINTNDGYLFNVNTSGVWQGVLLTDSPIDYPPSPAVLSGQHNNARMAHPGVLDVDNTVAMFSAGNTASNSTTYPGGQSLLQPAPANAFSISNSIFRARLFTMDGSIWALNKFTTFSDPQIFSACAFEELPAFSTRSLLGASVTKNSSQTMRIAYTMTFT